MAKNDFDDFEGLDDFDKMFGDMDTEIGHAARKNKPLKDFTIGFIGGVKDTLKDYANTSSNYSRFADKLGFKGIASAIDLANEASEAAGEILDSAKKELKDPMKELLNRINSNTPDNKKFIKASIQKAKSFFDIEDDSEYSGPSDQEKEDADIKKNVEDTFGTNTLEQASAEITQNARFQAQFKQSGVANVLLGTISTNIAALNRYNSAVDINYKKKSLELQYRSILLQKKNMELSTNLLGQLVQQSKAIQLNTALSDHDKVIKSENINHHLLRTYIKKRGYSLVSNSQYIKNLKDKIKSKIGDSVQGIRSGVEGVNMTAEMMGGMGLSPLMALGGMITGLLPLDDAIQYSLAPYIKKKIHGNSRFKKASDALEKYTLNTEAGAGRLLKNFRKKMEVSWDDELEGKHPIKNAAKKMIGEFLENISPYRPSMTLYKKDHGTALHAPAIFTLNTQKSITTIIPGYLARILQQVTIQNTANPLTRGIKAPLLEFNHDKNQFLTTKRNTSKYRGKIDRALGGKYARQEIHDLVEDTFGDANLSTQHKDALKGIMASAMLDKQMLDKETLLSDHYTRHLDSSTKEALAQAINNKLNTKENDLNFQRKATRIQNSIGDVRPYIEEIINEGGAENLIRLKLIRRTGSGNYEINHKKLSKFLSEGAKEARPVKPKTGAEEFVSAVNDKVNESIRSAFNSGVKKATESEAWKAAKEKAQPYVDAAMDTEAFKTAKAKWHKVNQSETMGKVKSTFNNSRSKAQSFYTQFNEAAKPYYQDFHSGVDYIFGDSDNKQTFNFNPEEKAKNAREALRQRAAKLKNKELYVNAVTDIKKNVSDLLQKGWDKAPEDLKQKGVHILDEINRHLNDNVYSSEYVHRLRKEADKIRDQINQAIKKKENKSPLVTPSVIHLPYSPVQDILDNSIPTNRSLVPITPNIRSRKASLITPSVIHLPYSRVTGTALVPYINNTPRSKSQLVTPDVINLPYDKPAGTAMVPYQAATVSNIQNENTNKEAQNTNGENKAKDKSLKKEDSVLSILKKFYNSFVDFSNSIVDVRVISNEEYQYLSKNPDNKKRVRKYKGWLGRTYQKMTGGLDSIKDHLNNRFKGAKNKLMKGVDYITSPYKAIGDAIWDMAGASYRGGKRALQYYWDTVTAAGRGIKTAIRWINPLTAIPNAAEKLWKGARSGHHALTHLGCKAEDVYILESEGKDGKKVKAEPVLTKLGFNRDQYFNANGKPIHTTCDIKGDVFDKDGNILLTANEIKHNGIYNKEGKPIKLHGLLRRTIGFIGKRIFGAPARILEHLGTGLGAGLKGAGAVLNALGQGLLGSLHLSGLLGTGVFKLGGLIGSPLKGLKNLFKNPFRDPYVKKSYNVLVEIKNAILHCCGKKITGSKPVAATEEDLQTEIEDNANNVSSMKSKLASGIGGLYGSARDKAKSYKETVQNKAKEAKDKFTTFTKSHQDKVNKAREFVGNIIHPKKDKENTNIPLLTGPSRSLIPVKPTEGTLIHRSSHELSVGRDGRLTAGVRTELHDPNAQIYADKWWKTKKRSKGDVIDMYPHKDRKGNIVYKNKKSGGILSSLLDGKGMLSGLLNIGEDGAEGIGGLLGMKALLKGKKLFSVVGSKLKGGISWIMKKFGRLFGKGGGDLAADAADSGVEDGAMAVLGDGAVDGTAAIAGGGLLAGGASLLPILLEAAALAGVGYLAYDFGTKYINPLINKAVSWISGGKVKSLGAGIADGMNDLENWFDKIGRRMSGVDSKKHYEAIETDKNAPLGIQLNNPGYIRFSPWHTTYPTVKGYIRFPTPLVGLYTLASTVKYLIEKGHNTPLDIVKQMNLPGYQKDPKQFLVRFGSQIQMPLTHTLDGDNEDILDRLINGIIIVQNGKQYYSPLQISSIAKSTAKATITIPNNAQKAPPSIKKSIKPSLGIKKGTTWNTDKHNVNTKNSHSIIPTSARTLINMLKSGIGSILGFSSSMFKSVDKAMNSVGSVIGGAYNGIKAGAINLEQYAIKGIGDLTGSLKPYAEGVINCVKEFGLSGMTAFFESHGNPGMVSNGASWGDPGGNSYGAYQLSYSKQSDGLTPFLDYISNTNEGKALSKHPIGSPAFNQMWKQLGATDPAFSKLQTMYNKVNYFDPLMHTLAAHGLDFTDKGFGTLALLDGLANGMGVGGAVNWVLLPLFSGKDFKKLSGNKICAMIGDFVQSHVSTIYSSSNPSIQQSVALRWVRSSKIAMILNKANISNKGDIKKSVPKVAATGHTPKLDPNNEKINKAITKKTTKSTTGKPGDKTNSPTVKPATKKDLVKSTAHALQTHVTSFSTPNSGPKPTPLPVIKTTNHDDVKHIHHHVSDIHDLMAKSVEIQTKIFNILKEENKSNTNKSKDSDFTGNAGVGKVTNNPLNDTNGGEPRIATKVPKPAVSVTRKSLNSKANADW